MGEIIKDSLYYAKILLFGEYGIIENSMGLSIPYHFFKGNFDFASDPNEVQKDSNESIKEFVSHLELLRNAGDLPCAIDFTRLHTDLESGLFFDSSIPQGFGVGSSGALVAAVYAKYAVSPVIQSDVMLGDNLKELKLTLAKLESFFHGKSSGLDPLNSYLSLPILINSKTNIEPAGIPSQKEGKGAVFLLDSEQVGETEPMVNIFMEKLKEEGFRNMLKDQFTKYNDECITSFLKGDIKPLFRSLKKLSGLLLENFTPMIPDSFHRPRRPREWRLPDRTT